MPRHPVVHIIDDDAAVRDSLAALLRVRGLAAIAYASAEAFLEQAPPEQCGCILTDVQMPRLTGLDLLGRLETAHITLPVIVMTGRATRTMAAEAVERGAWGFLDKPFGPDEIVSAVERAIADCKACA